MVKTDVAIIGAGPVGLFAIFECGMLRLSCHVFDALDRLGGQCSALYPEKPIYDIPGYPKINAQDLVDNLVSQAEPFKPTYHLDQQVTSITSLSEDGKKWHIQTSKGVIVESKAIIIAAGVGAFGPNRPPLLGIENFEGHSVHYYVNSRESYRGKKILIAGGGDSAVDWALSLVEVAARVTVVHRRARFRAAPENEAKLYELAEENKIDLLVPFQLFSLEGKGNQLESICVESLDGLKKTIKADVLLPFFGLSMNLGPIADWGLGLHKHHITVAQSTNETNCKGIYAIGDIATYPHKLKLILTGFAESAQAAHHIRQFLYPDEILHFEYSTTKGIN